MFYWNRSFGSLNSVGFPVGVTRTMQIWDHELRPSWRWHLRGGDTFNTINKSLRMRRSLAKLSELVKAVTKMLTGWIIWVPVCWIFRPAFGCGAIQMLVEICFFNIVCAKSWKKEGKARKLSQNLATKCMRWKVWSTAGCVFHHARIFQIFKCKVGVHWVVYVCFFFTQTPYKIVHSWCHIACTTHCLARVYAFLS